MRFFYTFRFVLYIYLFLLDVLISFLMSFDIVDLEEVVICVGESNVISSFMVRNRLT